MRALLNLVFALSIFGNFFLGLSLILYRKDLKKISEDLGFIRDKTLENKKLSTRGNREEFLDLIGEINYLLSTRQDLEIDARSREKDLKNLVASISHDLRTPLTSIKGYADLILKIEEREEIIEYVEIIKSRSKALENLISSFYELAKLEIRDENYDLKYVDIKEVFIEVLSSYYDRFQARNIRPNLEIDQGDFLVLGNEKSFERIFINLIENSLRYSLSQVSYRFYKGEKGYITELINDTDYMTEEELERLFQKFYVLDSSRQKDSTGLGLYITRELVMSLGYDIQGKICGGDFKIILNWY